MSRDNVEKAEIDRAKKVRKAQEKAEKNRVKTARKVQEKAESVEKDRAQTARKVQEKAEKADRAEKDRAEKTRKVQEKAESVEKDRFESARQSERTRIFKEFLSHASARSKGCCEPCNFHVKTDNGEYEPCKLGHKDSGPNKEICADCTESRYHPKK